MGFFLLDNTTYTLPFPSSLEAMMSSYQQGFFSPTSTPKGHQLMQTLEESKQILAEFIGIKKKEHLHYFSSPLEGYYLLLENLFCNFSYLFPKKEILFGFHDHAIIQQNSLISEKLGFTITPLKESRITLDIIKKQASKNTLLLSIPAVDPQTGVVTPLQEIITWCHKQKILLHIDATHLLSTTCFHPENLGIDFLTFHGIGIYAPAHTFLLWTKKKFSTPSPHIFFPGLFALASSAQQIQQKRETLCFELGCLKHQFEKQITKGYPKATVLFKKQQRVPHITCICFKNIYHEALLWRLNKKGIFANIGGMHQKLLSESLLHCGIEEKMAASTLSFCFSPQTTEKLTTEAANIICQEAKALCN